MNKSIFLFASFLCFVFSGCTKCEDCSLKTITTLKRTYNFPVEGIPDTTVVTIQLCEEELEELGNKTIFEDSISQGLDIQVERTYNCPLDLDDFD